MSPKRFEDVDMGDDLPEVKPDVSMESVRRFGKVSGMMTGRFTDHEEAKKQGLPGAIVPGIMSQAILASIIHKWAPGCHIKKIDTIFRAPVLVDSEPTCRSVVTHTDSDDRTVEIDLTIVNEAGETGVMGTATVEL